MSLYQQTIKYGNIYKLQSTGFFMKVRKETIIAGVIFAALLAFSAFALMSSDSNENDVNPDLGSNIDVENNQYGLFQFVIGIHGLPFLKSPNMP